MPKLDFTTMKPRAVEAYLREKIRELFGDAVENAADVFSSHGYYTVSIEHDGAAYDLGHFRKQSVPRIVGAMKFLAGK